MMKKILTGLLLVSAATQGAFCRHHHSDGGAVAAGALGGVMIGSIMGSAAAESSNRQTRVEDKIESVQREQDQQKVSQLQRDMDKKELEAKLEQQRANEQLRLHEQQKAAAIQQERDRANSFMYLLFGVIFIMFLAIAGLGIVLLHTRKKS